ncbi:MBL fold metallo-hydrolase [Cellulophaga baltica]|uniref:MBL fold metallo-hydrolase n=1 Tax=Cellulophaga TaxID=104264 RepID=UPI001C075303|nr:MULTISPECIES: MBL fold metallo-hydrolase [Cellulophaga]MBU2995848.1 MBL fold metallo-hydrolase [Cellulophaga baltica]MDO6767243.1 MBL fold metallo-hydrolase [Cellulophaga sp. 1_MG-2023]
MFNLSNKNNNIKNMGFKTLFLGLIFLFFQNINSQDLNLKYLGVAGWEISDDSLTILVDPYISRLKFKGNPRFYGKGDNRPVINSTDVYVSDTVAINKVITKADYILVHHSHTDHLADVPYIAQKTGAVVIGTETTNTILKAYGIPQEQLITVKGGEDFQFDKFSVRVIPSIHSALGDKRYFDARTYTYATKLKVPLKDEEFIEGGSLMFMLRINSHKILTSGSMNFIEREVAGLKPDVLIPGINLSRLEIYKYTERLLKLTDFPKTVIPTHWDNFRVPYGYSQESAIEKKVKPFIEEVKAVSPDSKVIVPVHLETIIIK